MLQVNKVFLVTGATGYLAANFLNFIQVSRPDFFEAYNEIFLFDRHLKLSRLDLGILENNKIKKIAFDLSQVEEFTCSLESLLISAKSDSSTLGKGLDETSVFNLEILHFASLNNLEAEKLFIKGFQEFALYQNFKQQLLDSANDEQFTVKINAEAERQIIRDFVNISDFCLILLCFIEAKTSGIYNVTSEKVTYLEDFAEEVKNDLFSNSLLKCEQPLAWQTSLDLSLSKKRIYVAYQGFKTADIKVSHLSAKKLRGALALNLTHDQQVN